MTKKTVYDQRLLDLYDGYAHGLMSRRQFLDRAAAITAGISAATILSQLCPDYARAQQVSPDDPAIDVGYQEYASPKGAGTMRGYLAAPARAADGDVPGVVVIHENRGLNPYIEDVARRVASAGFIALAPDALAPLGGYPGNDDDGRELMRQRDADEMIEDFVAAVEYLQQQERCTGTVGCVGFCYGGSVSNELAVRVPDLAAAVPFYGGQPAAEEVPRIKAPLLIHYAELDERINAGWPAYRDALEAAGRDFTVYFYEGTNHGFHNDTTPRFDPEAAELAWKRTIEFFGKHLV